jgi:O-phosphoseryl-tRNA(Cys) synthetase
MPTFRIAVREVHISTREIEAETAEEALRLYKEGEDEGDEISCEYSHTLEGDDAITLAR